ncbi:unnamed protein product [Soboliphyme baturini]|uniref:Secreted protein n=1 Tax=Soboliphyme baturini TaxID=241478 RepID=A0A183IYR6_9BILA|nr:unnamed protein product [Soboliphyme baturini]
MDRRSLTVACLLLGAVIAWPSRKKSKGKTVALVTHLVLILASKASEMARNVIIRCSLLRKSAIALDRSFIRLSWEDILHLDKVKELKDTLVKVNTLKDSKVEDRSLSEQLWQTLNTVIKQNFSFNSILQQLAARLRDKLIGSLPIIGKVIRRDGRQRRWDKNLVNF